VGTKKNPGILPGHDVLFKKFGGSPWWPDPVNSDEVLYLFHFDEILAVIEW
jgi:hypothetical protein